MRSIKVYRTFRDDRLKAGWRDLSRDGDYFVQSSYEWMAAWWECFPKKSRELLIVTVEEEGSIIGIGPFMIERNALISQLKFVGSGLTDYHEILVSADGGQAVLSMIMDYVGENDDTDLINLEQVSDHSPLFEYLKDLGRFSKRTMVRCLTINLDFPSWEEYLKNIGRNLKRDWTRKHHRLATMGDLKLIKLSQSQAKREWLDDLLSLHVRRWDREDEVSKFGEKRIKAFLARVVEELPQATIYVLQLDDRAIAYRLGFAQGQTFYDWNTSHDPDFAPQSVGKVLMGLVIKDLIACGFKRLNLMRGDYEWKRKWMTDDSALINCQFLARSSPVRGYLGERYYLDWKWRLKNRSRRILGLPIIQRLMIKARS
ncbi:MAG: GNAT family N-acetyltransferase [Candidatus Aminicenantales bacterium]